MKRIIEESIGDSGLDYNSSSDAVKLRVRGKGSGYKEGVEKMGKIKKNIKKN